MTGRTDIKDMKGCMDRAVIKLMKDNAALTAKVAEFELQLKTQYEAMEKGAVILKKYREALTETEAEKEKLVKTIEDKTTRIWQMKGWLEEKDKQIDKLESLDCGLKEMGYKEAIAAIREGVEKMIEEMDERGRIVWDYVTLNHVLALPGLKEKEVKRE